MDSLKSPQNMGENGGMLHAFIDESGQRAVTAGSSEHFIMSAAVVWTNELPRLGAAMATLRADLNRRPEHTLSWKHLKSHEERLHASQSVGRFWWVRTVTVVVCKRHLTADMDDNARYLYTFRLLLERLSWLARDHDQVLSYTLAHITRLKMTHLRQYEAALRAIPTTIKWAHLDPKGGSFSTPEEMDELQLADFIASATARAFEPDRYGNTERRYLEELSPLIWRRPGGSMTTYGMKMHPWRETTKAAYPWVAAL